jgi:serine phosphatase RsbU (regulator of sigma subunit)
MKRAVILCLEEDKEQLNKLTEQVATRTGPRAKLLAFTSVPEFQLKVKETSAAGELALVMVAEEGVSYKGHELLTQLQAMYPDVSKLLLVHRPNPDTLAQVLNKATAFHVLVSPWQAQQLTALIDLAVQRMHRISEQIELARLMKVTLSSAEQLLDETNPDKMLEKLLEAIVLVARADRATYIRQKKTYLEIGSVVCSTPEQNQKQKTLLAENTKTYTEALLNAFNETLEAEAASFPSRLVVPVYCMGENIGYMFLENPDTLRHFGNAEADVVHMLSGQTALSFEYATRLKAVELEVGKADAVAPDIAEIRELLRVKDLRIQEGLHYARRIQESMMSDWGITGQFFPDSFIVIQPKEVVSGDFCWCNEKFGSFNIAAVDCTGHGVPGAFMSVVGTNHLNQIIKEYTLRTPGEMLNSLHSRVQTALLQHREYADTNDAMDIALCTIDTTDRLLQFAGAGRPAYIIRTDGELIEMKGSPHSIGGQKLRHRPKDYENHHYFYTPGDMLYLFSDGITDQAAAITNLKFTTMQLKEMLLSIYEMPVANQKLAVEHAIERWKKDAEQTDDILLIGIRLA